MTLMPLSIPSPSERRLVPRPGPAARLRASRSSSASSPPSGSSERRWVARGGTRGEIQDLAVWAVPFGLVGGRLYHVATDQERYFGADGSLWEILYVWRGGLGVWGAIALGAVGVVVGAGRAASGSLPVLDAMAPERARRPGASAAGATGSTRSSSASPPTCPGASRSTPSTGRRATPTEDDVPPDVPLRVRSGACGVFAVIVWADRRLQARPRPGARALRDGLHARPRLDRDAAHRHRRARRRRRPAASTSGPRSCCSCSPPRGSSTPGAAGRSGRTTLYAERRDPRRSAASSPMRHPPKRRSPATGAPLIA